METLLPLTFVDILLLPQLIYMCPRQELEFIFHRIDLISVLAHFVMDILLRHRNTYEFRKQVRLVMFNDCFSGLL